MPKLREIAAIINTAIQAGPFNNRHFQGATYATLGYLVAETNQDKEIVKRSPMSVDEDGEGVSLVIDDTVPFQLYHRNLSLLIEDSPEEDFGDPGDSVREVADMVMILIGDRSKLHTTQEEVVAALWSGIPRELTVAELTTLSLQKVLIEPGEVNVNMEEVYAQEYFGVEWRLKPNNFMLAVRYRIVSVYGSDCFEICE